MSHNNTQRNYTKALKLPKLESHILLGVVVGLVVFVLDQLSKYIIRTKVVPQDWDVIYVLPIFNINHAWNYGVSFSMMAGGGDMRRYMLIAMALALSAVVAWWLRSAANRLEALSYGLILGGAFGNICDRVVHGAVFDFLQFHLDRYYWPSFNLADSAIFVGVALLLWENRPMFLRKRSGS